MGAESALALGKPLHDRGDRNDRSVAGENGVGAHVAFYLGKKFLLQRQVLGDGFDDIVGVAHRVGENGARVHASGRAFVLAEIAQIGGNARFGGVEVLRHRVSDRHLMAGNGENLRDAVAHEAGADDGNPRLLGHIQPAV